MHGRGVDTEFALEKAMQPDFLFVSDAEVVSLEMKVNAKSSVSQVLKYALLGLAVELHVGGPRRHHLAFLGRGEFADLWHERFASAVELRLAIARTDLGSFLRTQPGRFSERARRFSEIVSSLDLGFISYPLLASFLRDAAPPDDDHAEAAEVYRRLIGGVLEELRRRQLAP